MTNLRKLVSEQDFLKFYQWDLRNHDNPNYLLSIFEAHHTEDKEGFYQMLFKIAVLERQRQEENFLWAKEQFGQWDNPDFTSWNLEAAKELEAIIKKRYEDLTKAKAEPAETIKPATKDKEDKRETVHKVKTNPKKIDELLKPEDIEQVLTAMKKCGLLNDFGKWTFGKRKSPINTLVEVLIDRGKIDSKDRVFTVQLIAEKIGTTISERTARKKGDDTYTGRDYKKQFKALIK
jgi:hypothetical protein